MGATLAVAVVVLGAGCGDDDDDGSQPDTTEATVEGEAPTTQPASLDESAVRPYIEDLLAAWDEAMTPILGDPQAVADDPENPLRAELAELFTAESPYVEDLGALMASYVAQDTGLQPGPSGRVQTTTFLDFTQTPDDDHLEFVFCTFTDGVDFALSTGEERPPTVGIRQGAGGAVRVDGVWLLHTLQRLGFEEQPVDTPNPCPDLATAEDG